MVCRRVIWFGHNCTHVWEGVVSVALGNMQSTQDEWCVAGRVLPYSCLKCKDVGITDPHKMETVNSLPVHLLKAVSTSMHSAAGSRTPWTVWKTIEATTGLGVVRLSYPVPFSCLRVTGGKIGFYHLLCWSRPLEREDANSAWLVKI